MHNIMDIITLGNHVVRKALKLSLNEMAVLCDIVKMSNSPKYNFTCRKSKEKIADWLDLSRQTVHTIIASLKLDGYIISFDDGLRPSELIYELNTASDEIEIYIRDNDVNNISKKISEIITKLSVKNLDTTVKKFDTGVKNLYSEVSKNFTQDISKNKDKEKINNIPSEKSEDNISLLTSNTAMYESKQTNIELNCTIPINDVTIPVEKPKKTKSNFQSNPDKYVWVNKMAKEFNKDLPKERQFTRPNKNGNKDEKAGTMYILARIYDKFGEEKATDFINYIMSKGIWRNPMSVLSLQNQEEFENFYQDPQEEQPKYLADKKFASFGRYKNEQEEPSLGSFYNEDSFYASLEYYYSNQFSGTELVKKVRERVKEINCKYNKY